MRVQDACHNHDRGCRGQLGEEPPEDKRKSGGQLGREGGHSAQRKLLETRPRGLKGEKSVGGGNEGKGDLEANFRLHNHLLYEPVMKTPEAEGAASERQIRPIF